MNGTGGLLQVSITIEIFQMRIGRCIRYFCGPYNSKRSRKSSRRRMRGESWTYLVFTEKIFRLCQIKIRRKTDFIKRKRIDVKGREAFANSKTYLLRFL